MEPKLKRPFLTKQCSKCGGIFGPESYVPTNSIFYKDGFLPHCISCFNIYLGEEELNWDRFDKICQLADFPFVPAELIKAQEIDPINYLIVYAKNFIGKEYEGIGWRDYQKAFLQLKKQNQLDEEIPTLKEEKIRLLKEKWGANYDFEALNYLETLYKGLQLTQTISSALQADQALKICKISYELDNKIRAGEDFDKMLTAYDKLVKTAEFTPKNSKNANDFDSVGELIKWLEKRGWKNNYYNNVPKDIVDETLKNIESYNQRLYTNESGIGEQINERIKALREVNEIEKSQQTLTDFGSESSYDIDSYDVEGYDDLFGNDKFDEAISEE